MSFFLRYEKRVWRGGLGKLFGRYCISLVLGSIIDDFQVSPISTAL